MEFGPSPDAVIMALDEACQQGEIVGMRTGRALVLLPTQVTSAKAFGRRGGHADNKDMNMKQNIAILVVISLVLTACATRPVSTTSAVCKTDVISAQVQSPPPQTPQPASVIYNYEQQSWPQSTPTHEWMGYVPNGYQPPPNNAFDAAPVYADAHSDPYAAGSCAPGVGLSLGFGIGAVSVGLGPYGISAGVGLGCFPIGVGFGAGCN